jgi:hypothetical protein
MYSTCVLSLLEILVSNLAIANPRVYSLVLVLLQNFVSIVFNATNHVRHKVCGLALKEPGECNDTLRNGAQVVEEW